ncbi:MAG: response regulator, partial [Bacteroidales bacterium]|nr:response regulator [Bacteroidales bacterium]
KERVSLLQMDLSEYTLLIVDDSAANRHLIMEYLAPSGAKIIEAGNGQQAYEKAQELLPSIIFLDIRMPVMDGFETAEALKIYPPTRDIPLVAFTANVSFDSEDKYQEVGFEHVLLKPIDFEKLGDILQDLLKIDSVIEEQRITETIIENNGFENIQIIDLRKAYKELASLMEEWEQVKDNKFVNVILEFGSKIIGIGERYSVDAIITYGKQLQANAYSFDTEKIEQDLSLFPSLINELNSYLND